MSDPAERIADNVAGVRGRIAEAAQRSGRLSDDVTLVCVTKYVGVDETRALLSAGCHDLGESRPQQLFSKAEALASELIHWHLIGQLQRNKVRRTLPLVSLIHSADRLRLIEAIDREAAGSSRSIPVLLEVNISGDTAKHGFVPDALEAAIASLADFDRVQVHGLMTMAGRTTGVAGARRDFAELRRLRDKTRLNCPPSITLDELSMGMSGDYEVAIEEGATIVRVGSALFEGISLKGGRP
jgi:pyridoxal phosphate enzyme (YggS family)